MVAPRRSTDMLVVTAIGLSLYLVALNSPLNGWSSTGEPPGDHVQSLHLQMEYSEPSEPNQVPMPYHKQERKHKVACPAGDKGYHIVTCPVWYDENDPEAVKAQHPVSLEKGIDFRVRYIHKHQYPSDCRNQKFFISSFIDSSMINAFHQTAGRGLWGAFASGRVSLGMTKTLSVIARFYSSFPSWISGIHYRPR